MIFQHTWQRVLDGTKTQTRRPCKPGEFYEPADAANGYPEGVFRWKRNDTDEWLERSVPKYIVGKDYAVQPGRGQKAVGRIRITGIRRENVRKISDDDARAEGFASRNAFLYLWQLMHDEDDAWVIEFERVI